MSNKPCPDCGIVHSQDLEKEVRKVLSLVTDLFNKHKVSPEAAAMSLHIMQSKLAQEGFELAELELAPVESELPSNWN